MKGGESKQYLEQIFRQPSSVLTAARTILGHHMIATYLSMGFIVLFVTPVHSLQFEAPYLSQFLAM
jgi:hypothetical protein